MSNEILISHLQALGVVKAPDIIQAFKAIDRKNFVPPPLKDVAYFDHALPIGYSQTISQPSTTAFMLELLRAKPGHHILDIGSGSGWTTALLGKIVGSSGKVTGVERLPELVSFGRRNIEQYQMPQIEIVEAGDELGLPELAPFDRILVSAELPEIPDELITQLALGGRMVLPVEKSLMLVYLRKDGIVEVEEYPGFAFVPLILNEA